MGTTGPQNNWAIREEGPLRQTHSDDIVSVSLARGPGFATRGELSLSGEEGNERIAWALDN